MGDDSKAGLWGGHPGPSGLRGWLWALAAPLQRVKALEAETERLRACLALLQATDRGEGLAFRVEGRQVTTVGLDALAWPELTVEVPEHAEVEEARGLLTSVVAELGIKGWRRRLRVAGVRVRITLETPTLARLEWRGR